VRKSKTLKQVQGDGSRGWRETSGPFSLRRVPLSNRI